MYRNIDIKCWNINSLQVLQSRGASVLSCTKEKQTALHLAAKRLVERLHSCTLSLWYYGLLQTTGLKKTLLFITCQSSLLSDNGVKLGLLKKKIIFWYFDEVGVTIVLSCCLCFSHTLLCLSLLLSPSIFLHKTNLSIACLLLMGPINFNCHFLMIFIIII